MGSAVLLPAPPTQSFIAQLLAQRPESFAGATSPLSSRAGCYVASWRRSPSLSWTRRASDCLQARWTVTLWCKRYVRTPAVGSVLGACASGADSGCAWFDGGMFSTLYENRTNTHYMYVNTILLLNRMCYGREECWDVLQHRCTCIESECQHCRNHTLIVFCIDYVFMHISMYIIMYNHTYAYI